MEKIIFTTISLLCGLYTLYALIRNIEDIHHPSEKAYIVKGSVSVVVSLLFAWLSLDGLSIPFILI
ncbi:hypothetical protein [Bacillus thuringiensis]|uniref:hypothetical protein n=1 Tax=Bacillus thuringiensis TaxID=1428 RepID=UPI0011A84D53|nr:hypothetical protein [Bacillus thuringiensis]